MDTARRNRLIVAAGIGVLILIVVAAALVLPARTLAQAGEFDRAQAGVAQAGTPPPPPPPLHLNPATPTPEPGAVQASASPQAGSSDLEVIPFRPHITLRRGEAPHVATAQKAAGAAGPDNLKRPAEETTSPQEAYQAPDVQALLAPMGWNLVGYEGFEGVFPPPTGWTLEDFSADGYERLWDDTNWIAQQGSWSAWPAAGGANGLDPNTYFYPDNVNSWMEYGPFNFTNVADIFVSFGLWYRTEPQFDWVYFCTSVDFVNYSCDYWSGDSGGWTDQAYWLTSYAGYSQVWLAWVFQSDSSIQDDGPFVDEIYVLGYEDTAPVVPGQLIQNGSFETGDLTYWSTDGWNNVSVLEDHIGHFPSLRPGADQGLASDNASPLEARVGISGIGVTTTTSVDGQYSAFLLRPGEFGGDFLYQVIHVPSNATDIVLDFWSLVETNEAQVNTDLFCAGLWSSEFPNFSASDLLVDLGCLDAVETTNVWQEIVHTLTFTDVNQVAGKSVALAFELYNRGETGSGTTARIDAVQVQAIGAGGSHLDLNEPNDDSGNATLITCGQTITGVIGDALGGYDVDWFVLSSVPEGQLDVDIDAYTKTPRSELDSVVYLHSSALDLIEQNDDSGGTFDSYITYTNDLPDATFYVRVESYSGYGSADSFYDLTVRCASSSSGPPTGSTTQPVTDTWTVMLYLNAEDASFEELLTQYRRDIEAFIGSKDAFLKVVILYDGPGRGDTTLYLVQPNGVYESNPDHSSGFSYQNRWDSWAGSNEHNMGDRDTLATFVDWVMERYPAENYYLAIDDHGDGVYGISIDPTSDDDLLTPDEVYAALRSATRDGDPNRRIDILDYEACLMGLAENAYDVREWVDYVVFSEQISWGINTYPVYFRDLAAADTPLTVGQRIVDRYHAQALAANYGRGYPHTISLVDTSKMVAVRNTVTDFGNTIKATNTEARKNAINTARNNAQAFAADMDATNPVRAEYIDLWDLADEASSRGLAALQAAAIKVAVSAAVVHEHDASGGASGYIWDHSGAHGLAIYYPPTKSSSAFSSYCPNPDGDDVCDTPNLYQMGYDGTWDEFLNWAVPSGTRRGMSANRAEIKLTGDDAFAFKYVYLPAVLKMH